MGPIIVIGRQQSLCGCQCLCMPSKLVAEVTAAWNKILKIIMQHYCSKFCIYSPLESKEDNTVWKNRGIDGSEIKSDSMTFGL